MRDRPRQVRGVMGRVVGAMAAAAAALAALCGGLALAGALDWRLDILTHLAPGYVALGVAERA